MKASMRKSTAWSPPCCEPRRIQSDPRKARPHAGRSSGPPWPAPHGYREARGWRPTNHRGGCLGAPRLEAVENPKTLRADLTLGMTGAAPLTLSSQRRPPCATPPRGSGCAPRSSPGIQSAALAGVSSRLRPITSRQSSAGRISPLIGPTSRPSARGAMAPATAASVKDLRPPHSFRTLSDVANPNTMKKPKHEYDNDTSHNLIQREMDGAFSAGIAEADGNARRTLRVCIVPGCKTPTLTATCEDMNGKAYDKFMSLRRAIAASVSAGILSNDEMASWAKELRSIARALDARAKDGKGGG